MAVSLIGLLFSLVVAAILTVVGGFLGVALMGWLYRAGKVLAGLPRVSTVVPVPPMLVAGVAAQGVYAAIHGWPYARARTDEECLRSPTTPISVFVTPATLGCPYLVIVESGAASIARLSTLAGVAIVVSLGVVLAFAATVGEARGRIADLRASVVTGSTPIGDATPGVEATTRRLAQLADVRAPEVRVVETDRPELLTVGTGEDAVVVVTAGLLEALTEAELEAALAHEVSHLANGGSRVLGAALPPVTRRRRVNRGRPGQSRRSLLELGIRRAEDLRPIRRRRALPRAGVVCRRRRGRTDGVACRPRQRAAENRRRA